MLVVLMKKDFWKVEAHTCCGQFTAVKTVSADRYHITVSRDQLSTQPADVFFEVVRWASY